MVANSSALLEVLLRNLTEPIHTRFGRLHRKFSFLLGEFR
jgi:hypothetical protein